MTVSSLQALPVEIFHEIFDYVDASTIFSSFYNACQQFNVYIISYNRYKLNFNLISRSDSEFFCRVIHPKYIISLILSDDNRTPDQIDLFLSLVDIEELGRLRSLTLQVKECNLVVFLQCMPIPNLISLSIKWRRELYSCSNPTQVLTLLFSAIAQPNLRHLDFNLWNYEIKNLSWPIHCTVQYLCIDGCSFSEYCLILRHSPHLKTLIVHHWSIFDIDNSISSSVEHTSYDQLFSLTLENIENIQINMLESLLSLTPSLVHLKMIGSGHLRDNAFDGSRWENLIQEYLPFLDKFQFCFTTLRNSDQNDDISLLITPFTNSFWIEKSWFVTCDCIKSLSQIKLYTIPLCQPYFEYASESTIIPYCTSITMDDDFDGLSDECCADNDIIPSNQIINNLIILQLIELLSELNRRWSIVSAQFFSTFSKISHLVKISLIIYFDNDSAQYTMNAINNLLEEAPNIRTFENNNNNANANIVCSIMPRHIKYLQVEMGWINDLKTVVDQLDHLSSITFQFVADSPNSCLHLWLDNNLTRL